jgi:hypothetical protein
MMANEVGTIARAEIFEIDSPRVNIEAVSSDIKIMESPDSKTYIEILGASEEAKEAAKAAEITAHGKEINVRIDRRDRGFRFFSFSRAAEISVVVKLPKTSELEVKTVSAEIEVQADVVSARLNSVSGGVEVSHNPSSKCSIRTISGDITCRTFSTCEFSLRSVSGDIKVYVASGLEIDVDGKSVSGDLQSEISLEAESENASANSESVTIRATTVSGDFKIVRG